MKKVFVMTVLIIITTVGFSYEYSHESVRYFSDKEIANLLPNIAKVNPHISNLNLIYPGEILNIPLDGTLVSIYIKGGDNISKILSFGIPEKKIFEAKLVYASTKGDTKVLPVTDTGIKERQPVPPYIWWNLFGTCLIFFVLFFAYIKRKKWSK